MANKKNIFVIIGSASEHSANEQLVTIIAGLTQNDFRFTIFKELKTLPHFDPGQSVENPPSSVVQFRAAVETADGIIICTPEYVFSIPSGLKNAIEWCVATTVFSDKPTGLITTSAHGQKGHVELQLIMKTVMSTFTPDTTLLIQGIKGKINAGGEIIHPQTKEELARFVSAFKELINGNAQL